ncbi:hypothetical protein [Cognatishimia sp. MH4019]|uniref:hypothetical protein n=1 Tax=Cognatishimia sp. MH4019 TaxID=2854030 RepID=UPI001CD1AE67|nr:hypothetical protein [Cognatishimia sp. MH4019]
MTLIADALLIAGALGATLYCLVLARKLNKFNDLEKGVGGAVAVMSAQVDDMTRTLSQAEAAAQRSASDLEAATTRAEAAVTRLELLLASLHDLPEQPAPAPMAAPSPVNETSPPPTAFVRHRERSGV